MLWFSAIAVQATSTRLFVVTVFIANLTIHPARGKHTRINIFFWHFHNHLPLSAKHISPYNFHFIGQKPFILLPYNIPDNLASFYPLLIKVREQL